MKQDQILELNFIKKYNYFWPNSEINKKAREDCMSFLPVKKFRNQRRVMSVRMTDCWY